MAEPLLQALETIEFLLVRTNENSKCADGLASTLLEVHTTLEAISRVLSIIALERMEANTRTEFQGKLVEQVSVIRESVGKVMDRLAEATKRSE